MLLDEIESLADLRNLDAGQLPQLVSEIRDFIVDAVNTHGGHLGSNLGVIELTIALHRVFDSPHDVILWDTGHQAYVHKLLTGRRKDFDKLRCENGLSGYPSRNESEHDWIENSHASTVVSYAHGLATAFKLQGESDRHVVGILGDGGMTGGMAYEGLNNLGNSQTKAIIILNDNGRSYAPTASKLSESLAKIRSSNTYRRQSARLDKILPDLPLGNLLEKGAAGAKAAIREIFEPPVFFEQLGVKYLGPYDGHDLAAMEEVLRNAKELDGPVVIHCLTNKGNGYPPAENDPIKNMHDLSDLKQGSFTAAFSDAVLTQASRRPELVAITAAMPDSTGLLPFMREFPERFFDAGIAEQHAVTSATGMAMGGLRPVVALYATFLSRAFDQVNLDVSLHNQPVVFALDRAGITGDDGPSHHGILDMVLMSKIPNATIFAPSSYAEVAQMLDDALELCTNGPSSIRFPKTFPEIDDPTTGTGLSARRVRVGNEICIIGVGKMLAAAITAADELSIQGIEATVWDPRVVKPLDSEMLHDAAGHKLVITIEDGLRDGGIGESILDNLSKLSSPNGPTVRVLGIPTVHLSQAKPDSILSALGLDAKGIIDEVVAWEGSLTDA